MIGASRSAKAVAKMLVMTMLCSLFWQIGAVSAEPLPTGADEGSGAGTGSPSTVTEQVYLTPVADAYVNAGSKSASNYGGEPLLLVKNKAGDGDRTRQSYMKFDLGNIPGVIEAATLRIFGELTDGEGNQVDIQVHTVADNSWSESGINWNNKPQYDAVIGTIAATKASPAKRWYEVDVTDYMKERMNGDRLASLALAQAASNGLIVQFNSKENSANQPELSVTYTPIADTEPPVWPAGSHVTAVPAQNGGMQLEWTPAEDNVWVASYRIYQDGQQIAEVSGSTHTYIVNGLNMAQSYSFKVVAGDAAGNWSADGPSVAAALPRTERFNASEDTHVNGGSYSVYNYGTNTELIVKNNSSDAGMTRRAFMKFDVAAFTEGVGTATLHYYGMVNDGQGSIVDTVLYGMDDNSWEESSMNWDNQPEMDHYIKAVTMNSTAKWHQVDVTSYVKQKIAEGTVSFGFAQLKPAGLVVKINSRENAANQPYLELSSARLNDAAPKWPAGSAVQTVHMTETSADLQWSAAGDAAAVTAYNVYQDGVLIAELNGQTLNYSASGLQLGGKYTFKVEAVNAAGQASTDGPYTTVKIPATELQQTTLGNVFIAGTPIVFKVPTVREQVVWKVHDLNGALMSEGTVNTANLEAVIEVPFTKLGYFMLEASVNSPGSQPIVLRTPFTVLSDYDFRAVDDSPFGVAAHLHRTMFGWSADLAQLIRYMGAKTARGGMEWASVEKEKGKYTLSPQPELFMNKLEEEGIKALFVAGYNNPFYDNNGTPYTDEGRKGFAGYANAYVNAYKDQLIGMQVYNEFNGGFGKRGNSPANSQPDYYFDLLKETYNTIKADNPNFTVSGMVTAGVPITWMEEVFQLGGLNYLDNVAVHPYRYPQTPEGLDGVLKSLQQLIRQYNNGNLKPIWISELGWPTHQDASGVDEKSQADYLVRAYVIALANNVDRMFWYDLMNDGINPNDNENNFGLIRNKLDALGAYTPKPAYVSYGVMTRQLTGAEYVSKDNFGANIQSYVFERNGQKSRVMWALEEQQIALETSAPLAITKMTGETEQFTPYNGKVYLTLTGEPIYVQGEVLGAAADATFAIEGDEASPGMPVQLTVLVNNLLPAPLTLDLSVEGKQYGITAEQGKQTSKLIEVAGAEANSYRLVVVDIKQGSNKIGELRYRLIAQTMHTVKIRPDLEASGDAFTQALRIEVDNGSKVKELAVSSVKWSIGEQFGEEAWAAVIKPGEKQQLAISLKSLETVTNYPAKVSVIFENADAYEYTGNISFNPIYEHTVNMAGEWDKAVEAHEATINSDDGHMRLNGYTGPDDISGKVWLNYDKDFFYLSAQITDDVHYAPMKGSEIWNNDGLQFSLTSGIPGESRSWYEYGISDTPDGPQIYRWTVPEGKEAGIVKNGKLTVTRDENSKQTFYQLALPWSELKPIQPGHKEAMSFSLVFNDNDGKGRKGYIEWGSGIGSEKSPKLFRAMQWMPAVQSVAPVAHDSSFTVKAGETLQGVLTADAAEAALAYEIVDNGKQGKAKLMDAANGKFQYVSKPNAAGTDQFTFRVFDGSSYSNTATVSITIVKAGEDATLKDLQLDGVTVPGFAPDKTSYDVVLDKGAALPKIRAIAADTEANVEVEPAAAVPGKATIKVISADGKHSQQYVISFTERQVEPPVNPPFYPGAIDPYQSYSGQLYLPAGVAGEISLGQQIKLTIPAGATDTSRQLKIAELEGQKLHALQAENLLSPVFELSQEPAGEFKKKATLRIAFDASKAGKEQVPALMRYDDKQKTWVKMDGKVDGNSFVAEIDQLGIYAVAALKDKSAEPQPGNELKDIAGHWGQSWIEKAVQAGIVKGYSDHTFRPDQAVSRQELVAMLVRALQPQAIGGKAQSFTDEGQIGNWAADAVAAAVQAGWITGYSDGSFRPQEGMTRVELAAVLARASASMGAEGAGQLSQFRDAEQIPAWAKGYVAAVADSSLMEGTGGGLFKPAGIVTRAEAAAIAVRLLEQVSS
ncbi:DNRLRE domain-containing protein [Paenibacillus sp. GCM10027626]|uniref:CBM96 family carbohydrate-binding protein n=1 Tax=Paenibacillus sp. GCM10027626 TaxID=3273411 RepID=UPI00362869FD